MLGTQCHPAESRMTHDQVAHLFAAHLAQLVRLDLGAHGNQGGKERGAARIEQHAAYGDLGARHQRRGHRAEGGKLRVGRYGNGTGAKLRQTGDGNEDLAGACFVARDLSAEGSEQPLGMVPAAWRLEKAGDAGRGDRGEDETGFGPCRPRGRNDVDRHRHGGSAQANRRTALIMIGHPGTKGAQA